VLISERYGFEVTGESTFDVTGDETFKSAVREFDPYRILHSRRKSGSVKPHRSADRRGECLLWAVLSTPGMLRMRNAALAASESFCSSNTFAARCVNVRFSIVAFRHCCHWREATMPAFSCCLYFVLPTHDGLCLCHRTIGRSDSRVV